MPRSLLLTIMLLYCLHAGGQNRISGKLLDSATRAVVPFVNIGIKGKNIGTVSSEDGSFSISVPDQYLKDTLSFSMVGFRELSIPVGELQKQTQFLLSRSPSVLSVHSVVAKRLVEQKYGLAHYKPLLHFTDGSVNQNDIFEIGQLVRLGSVISKLTSVSLYIAEPRNDSGIFRLNFYAYDGSRPAYKVVDKNIIQKHAITAGWLHLDISAHKIYLKGDVVVSIEFIPTKSRLPIVYEIKPGGRIKSFVRSSSLGTWQVPPHQYRMYVSALGTGTPEEEQIPEREFEPAFALASKSCRDSFFIAVRLPDGYDSSSSQQYPTVYVLDANLYFGYLSDSLDRLKGAAQPLLVGVGYRNFYEMDSLRNRDYTYPKALKKDSFAVSGGAEQFLTFLRDELVPVIDKRYRTDQGSRSIMGHSLGGYFVLYALYRELADRSSLFRNYTAVSPSIHYHKEWLPKQFKSVIAIADTSKMLYLHTGSLEEQEDSYGDVVRRFNKILGTQDSVKTTYKVHLNVAHMETALPGFYEAMSRVLNGSR